MVLPGMSISAATVSTSRKPLWQLQKTRKLGLPQSPHAGCDDGTFQCGYWDTDVGVLMIDD